VDVFDVELRGVTKAFDGRRAVDQVSFSIRRGEFFSILGPSGCGKSTLLRLINGFEQPDGGAILLGGRDIARVPTHRRDVNMVFQSYALFPHLDVHGNVAFGLKAQKRARADIAFAVAGALDRVGLADYERRMPQTLSGGEQQRVALARAIVTGPRVLLLDEPLSALDLKLRESLKEELRRLQRELAMTFVYVTHDQEEALAISDRIAVMRDGALEQVGAPEEVYERPATRFVAGFVGAANFFEGTGDGAAVRTADGLVIQAPALGEVTLMVRPEKMRLNGGPGLLARVEEVLYQGASTAIILQAGERRLRVEEARDGSGNGQCVRVGDTLTVSWRPEDVLTLRR
jgi:ABC-type Fe3+/spermidine/putrescine transport system ATPase subunit